MLFITCLCVLCPRAPPRKQSAVFQETAIFIEQQKTALAQGSLQDRFHWCFSKTRQLITSKFLQYKNIFYTYMKIPKIKWYFFPVENTDYLGSLGVDGFLYLSLRKRLIAGEQNIDSRSMDQSSIFAELFNLETKKRYWGCRDRLILFFEGCAAQNELRVNVTNIQLFHN